jgi:hypothetical protein
VAVAEEGAGDADADAEIVSVVPPTEALVVDVAVLAIKDTNDVTNQTSSATTAMAMDTLQNLVLLCEDRTGSVGAEMVGAIVVDFTTEERDGRIRMLIILATILKAMFRRIHSLPESLVAGCLTLITLTLHSDNHGNSTRF